MAFSAKEITFLHGLVSKCPPNRLAGDVASYFCENHRLGRLAGRRIEYGQADYRSAEQLLRIHELPVASLGAEALRADVALFGGMSEKSFSRAPHENSVAVKPLGGCTLRQHALHVPAGGYMTLTVEQACQVHCDRLLIVENLETFRWLENYAWIDLKGLRFLVIYRGDADLPLRDAAKVVAQRTERLWAFFDFDPAGLGMASALPADRLELLLLPEKEWLMTNAKTSRGRDLYATQFQQYGALLDRHAGEQIQVAWALMRSLICGVTQERMRDAPVREY
jgi:hypothetical protein